MEGYIYKNRVTLLKKWDNVTNESRLENTGIYKKHGISVSISVAPFNHKKHKFYNSTQPELQKIDCAVFWGTDGEIPKQVLAKVVLTINGKTVAIPNSAFSDLYEPQLNEIHICRGPDNVIYLSMNNSDGAGGYTIIWIIKDGKYYARYIDDSMV